MNNNKQKRSMIKFAPSLGLIFGAAIGIVLSIITSQNIGVFAAIGTGFGLVVGSVIYLVNNKDNK